MRNLILFMPPELAVLMFIGTGFAMLVGARKLAAGLFGATLAVIFLPILLVPLFDQLPSWLLWSLLIFFGLCLLRSLFELVLGKRATDHMVGILAADVVRVVLLSPFRLLGWFTRVLWRHR